MARHTPLTILCILWLMPGGVLFAGDQAAYLRGVKPILAARCYACHGALKQKSGLRLDTVALMKKGGDGGAALVPGKIAESPLLARISSTGADRMPPPNSAGEPLDPTQIGLLKRWIEQGAAGPADEKPESDPRDHWAFKAIRRPAVPAIRHRQSDIANPIDAFIAAEYEKRGLTPQRPADRAVLLRRVYLDLIGLPPTRDELAAFLADRSPDAYEDMVERLLAGKQYGERWGRHWMDVWRYSDWWGLGAEVRNSQKHIWHWRDWIIESLNADTGYDQMLREMLAADELYPNDLSRLRATGYLARSYFKFNRNSWLDEVVEHTSKGLLGLTLNCAKCHDHKYDPLSQRDYYRMRAFFEPYQVRTDMAAGETDFEKDGLPRVFDCNLDTPTYLFVRGDEKQPLKSKPIVPGLPDVLSLGELGIRPVPLPLESHNPGLRSLVLENHLRAADRQVAIARQALKQGRSKLTEKALAAAESLSLALKARAAADRARCQQPPAANAQELARLAARAERQAAVAGAEESVARAEMEQDAKKPDAAKKLAAARTALTAASKALENPGEAYTPLRGSLKTLESNLETEASRGKPFPTTSTGRRSALAAWMTDARHPLTARVAVNHIWARHLGKPLVPTVFDFGRKGSPPTHPELLDWLAAELVQNGWSMKHLHRLIVTSNTYRLSSSSAGAAPATTAADPENRCYWRMNPVRMEAQVIRDSLLHLSGELDLVIGGPSVAATDETTRRRSLYFVHSHNDHNKFLSTFDDASVLECYRRAESIVPQQALALENSKLALATAEKIARRLNRIAADGAFVRAAFETVLGNPPTAEEQTECEAALKELSDLAAREKKPDGVFRARANLVHALLNHNDFVTVR